MSTAIPPHHPHNDFFLILRRPPLSTLFPTRRSSDLAPRTAVASASGQGETRTPTPAGHEGLSLACLPLPPLGRDPGDRKSTRLNSSHGYISYAVFCLKKKIYKKYYNDQNIIN